MIRVLAALSAALAIGAGAFGAHVATGDAVEWLATGAHYLLVHAVATLWVAGRSERVAAWMLGGATLFAGTLFLMALGLPRWLGAVTPIGGAIMIGAWIALAVELQRNSQA
jgi:uncharacterized membrane protein YgdD (TMEM256/DUF423 family)